jgi:hypothetical protein
MGDTTDIVTVLHAAAEDVAEPHRLAPRLPSLQSMTVGLIDNHKRNANVYLEVLGQLLQDRYGVSQAEHAERNPWEPLHVELGAAPVVSMVVVVAARGRITMVESSQEGVSVTLRPGMYGSSSLRP